MDKHQRNDELINGFYKYQKEIFESSEQAIYCYLDDKHKICNKKFATLLGYASPEEWAKVTESFPSAFVDEKSQELLVSTYQKAMEKMVASTVDITWKTKDGSRITTSVILTPISYKEHLFALHFVSKIQRN